MFDILQNLRFWSALAGFSLFSPPPQAPVIAGVIQVETRTIAVPGRAAPDIDRTLVFKSSIYRETVAAVAADAKHFPGIRRMVIDSDGGSVEAALELAGIVRTHGWDITVLNKCLSACASFVFPAGARKTVLPNSWVGIHEARQQFVRWDKSTYFVTGNEIDAAFFSQKLSDKDKDRFYAREDAVRSFYQSLGLSQRLLQDFANYVSRRKRVWETEEVIDYPDAPNCPRLKAWALSKKQLEQMGVKDIGDFWFPQSDAERKKLYTLDDFQPGSIFVGEARDLDNYCTGPTLGWFTRFWLKHRPG